MKRLFAASNAIIAISVGIIVLLGYFIPAFSLLRFILLQWSVILAGVAVLIGIVNLFSVHLQKIHEWRPGSVNSFVLLFFFLATALLTALVSVAPVLQPLQAVVLNGILIPTEISLMAVLAVTLIYASMRLLRVRASWPSILFLVTAFLVLLVTGPFPFTTLPSFISEGVRPFINNITSGGARGILIGIALGTFTTGLRILFGADRPYGGK